MQEGQVEVMKDLRGFLTVEQRRAMYHGADKWRDKLLIRLLWKSGRRISEVLALKVKDINFQDRKILWNILKKKNKKYKAWKGIDQKTTDLLGWFIQELDLKKEFYVLNPLNPLKPLSRQRAFQIIRRASKLAGINKVGESRPHPHHFRHSFAVDMSKRLKTPSDIRKLQRHLEHSSLRITEAYLQFGDDDLSEMLEED